MIRFISIVVDSNIIVVRVRRRFAITFISAKTSCIAFDNCMIKTLIISQLINLYNHFMNDVDTANQLKNYYEIQRVHKKH